MNRKLKSEALDALSEGSAQVHKNEYEKALPYLDKSLDLLLSNGGIVNDENKKLYLRAHYIKGVCYLNLNELDKSEAAFKRVLDVNPFCKKALTRLSSCYDAQGKYGPALDTIDRILQIDPTCNDAITLKEKLLER